MAEPVKTAEKPLKRCGESVTVLHLSEPLITVFGPSSTLVTAECPAKMKGAGQVVESMALHPAGVAVKYQGEVILVGTYKYARLAKGEA